jgi:Family of unknown function (DUF6510)
MERLDGNVLAGELMAIFGVEMTVATGVCDSCGRSGPVAELHVYRAAGWVARCPGCEAVLLTIVDGPGRRWLRLAGLRTLEVPLPA